MARSEKVAFKLEVDQLRLQGMQEELISKVLVIAKNTVRDGAKRLERDYEAITRAVVPGNAWKAWTSKAYPRGNRGTYEPTAEVFVKGKARSQGMMVYWTRPGVNRAVDGTWRAIPLPEAGVIGRGGNLTPRDWELRTGLTLRIAYPRQSVGKKWALLVTDGVYTKTRGSKAIKQRTVRRAAQGRQKVTRAIFLLIPEQRHANLVRLDPFNMKASQYIAESFDRRIGRINVF